MKKIIPGALLAVIFITGCQKTDTSNKTTPETSTFSQITDRTCASSDILAAQLAADPVLRSRRAALESFTKNVVSKNAANRSAPGITIPVVVNVVYNTAAENISDAQIQSQIDVLNEDFNKQNSDVGSVPSIYKKLVGEVGIHFILSSVVRKQSSRKTWAPVDLMKSATSGGIDATDPEHKLSIWTCNLGQNLLGYASFPGTVSPAADGAVILYSAFGSRAKYPGGTYLPNYDLGRTATHEIGHWMNLLHIWGDDGGSCAGSDLVDDTPNQAGQNYRCPVFPTITCNNNGDMSMNYMDYTYDKCMYMFSEGQAARSLAVFSAGAPRASYVQ
jgi:hypothetical protein